MQWLDGGSSIGSDESIVGGDSDENTDDFDQDIEYPDGDVSESDADDEYLEPDIPGDPHVLCEEGDTSMQGMQMGTDPLYIIYYMLLN